MGMEYAYLIGSLIMGIPWLVIFVWRKDLRPEMMFGGMLALPFALVEVFFVPRYWNPPSVFGLMFKHGFGIEDFIFLFFVGGIGAVVYEAGFRIRTRKLRGDHRLHLTPYFAVIALFVFAESVFPETPMTNLCAALFVGTLLIVMRRRDLIPQILITATLFTAFYFIFYQIFFILYPGYIEKYFAIRNLSGISVYNIPLEELLWGFFGSAFWSTLYEYAKGYKTEYVGATTVKH
jgi:hypothetical protein